MNRLELRSEVRLLIKDTDTYNPRWTDAQLNSRLDLAHDRIAGLTKCVLSTGNLTDIVSGTASYAQTGLLSVESVMLLNDNSEWIDLFKTTPQELDSLSLNWRSSTGTPTRYFMENNSIVLFPIPDYSKTSGLKADFYGRPTAFSDDTSEPFDSISILYPYHDVLAYEVARRCMLDENNPQMAKAFFEELTIRIREIKYELASSEDGTRMPNDYEFDRAKSRHG